MNKDGEWVGTPIQVERCVNDLILVDNALSESMLNPRLLKKTGNTQEDDEKKQDEDEQNDRSGYDDRVEDEEKNDENNAVRDTTNEMNETIKVNIDTSNADDKVDGNTNVRRSSRPRKQRMEINEEEIGDCDDKNDPDYK